MHSNRHDALQVVPHRSVSLCWLAITAMLWMLHILDRIPFSSRTDLPHLGCELPPRRTDPAVKITPEESYDPQALGVPRNDGTRVHDQNPRRTEI